MRNEVLILAVMVVTSWNFLQILRLDHATPKSIVADGNGPQKQHSAAFRDLTSIRVLVADGCSGSTAAQDLLREILKAHGLNISRSPFEPMKRKNNKYWGEARKNLEERGEDMVHSNVLMEAMKLMHLDAQSRQEVLVVKSGSLPFLHNFAKFEQMGMKFTFLYRWNALDRCVCMVRDCFAKDMNYGFPVFASNGTKSDLCFSRRAADEEIKAVFHHGRALPCVREMASRAEMTIQNITRLPFVEKEVSYEDLFAFEYSSEERVFNASLVAWESFVGPLLDEDEVNAAIIETILRREQDSRLPPKRHSDVIYNVAEVKKELYEDKEVQHYIRN